MPERVRCHWNAPLSAYEAEAQMLLDLAKANNDGALWHFKWMHPRYRGRTVAAVNANDLTIADSRLVIAQDYAFDNWNDLARFSDGVAKNGEVTRFEHAVEAVVAGDIPKLRSMLENDSGLIHARSSRRHRATLLHYIAANGVEDDRQKIPANAVDVARLLLDAGAKPDALAHMYDNECTTMSMLVSSSHPANAGLQAALAEILLDYGGKLDGPGTNWNSAIVTALAFGFEETAEILARRRKSIENILEASGLGRVEAFIRLLPKADKSDRHKALALAAQHGHVEIVTQLLDAGEDPSRYNPDGFHSHSSPLHQAVWSEHLNTVRLLVERGAKLDIRDTIYEGTPLGWARYGKKTEIAEYLLSKGAPE